MNRVLILVDIQNDFITGELPVPDGRAIVDPVNHLISQFDHVIATQDWHPYNHFSLLIVCRKAKEQSSSQNYIPNPSILYFVREQTLI